MDVLEKVEIADVPKALFKLSDAYLDAAENLNNQLSEDVWPSSYQRGQVVLFLAFHAVELGLKGSIKKLQPSFNAGHSTLAKLASHLRALAPEVEFEPPFGIEALPPDAEGLIEADRLDRFAHQHLRYPMDTKGVPWEGLFGFSADMFQASLAKMRSELHRVRAQELAK